MRSRVAKRVAIRWTATEEPALDRGLCGHGGTHSRLDPVAFTLAHAAVEAHDEIVCVGAGIDRPADLGHPQLDVVVHEHWKREPELVAVERTLRLSDDDRVPPAARIAKRLQQA